MGATKSRRVVLAMAIDQGLVALTEVHANSAKRSIMSPLGKPGLPKQGRHPPAAERKAMLGTQRQPVPAGGVDVPDRELGIIRGVIRCTD